MFSGKPDTPAIMARIVEPLFFERRLKEKIWGGNRLVTLFDWVIPDNWENQKKIGESWQLSDVPGEESPVLNRRFAGKTLRDLMKQSGKEILGLAKPSAGDRFPLLMKLLDTSDALSVQVHPDDALAAKWGERDGGKTEAWFVIAAEEGARLTAGLKPGTDAASFGKAIQSGSAADCLESFEVSPGDAILVPAGLVHAIGPGLTLAEIQQTSDLTYRLYDWGRLGDDGKPRELHVEKGLQASNYSMGKPLIEHARWRRPTPGFREGQLVHCDQFKLSLGEVDEPVVLRTPGRPVIVTVIEGEGEIAWGVQCKEILEPGATVLIPASLPEYELRNLEGRMRCLLAEPGPFSGMRH